MFPRWIGWLWLVAGATGVAAAVAVSSFGVAFIGSSSTAAVDTLEVTRDLLGTVDDTIGTVDDTLASVITGLDTLETSVSNGATTLTDVARLANDIGTVATVTVPDSLDSLREGMPQLIATAGVVDGVMRALSFVGADYDPEAPLDDSLRDLDLRLGVIPDQLRSQGDGFEQAAQGIADFGAASVGIARDIGDIRANISNSAELLGDYSANAEEALSVIDAIQTQILDQSRAAQVIVVVLGVALAVGQTVPIVAGMWVLKGTAGPIDTAAVPD